MRLSEKIFQFLRRGRRLAQRVAGKAPVIGEGPGRGLRFDPGPATAGFLSGKYELPVQEALSSLVRPGDVFYDIGANVGYFSILAGRLAGPGGAIYAFEPVPVNASLVERNARLNHLENVQVMRIAISRQTGRSELLLASYAGGAVLKGAGIPPDFAGSITVETSTVEDLLKIRKIRPPDIVKIDVEGAELDVLKGMIEVLREKRPKLIIEVDDANELKCEEKLAACREFLRDFRYRTKVLPNSYEDGSWFVRHIAGEVKSV